MYFDYELDALHDKLGATNNQADFLKGNCILINLKGLKNA